MDSEKISPNVHRATVGQFKVPQFNKYLDSSNESGSFTESISGNGLNNSQNVQEAQSKEALVYKNLDTSNVSKDFNESQLNHLPLYDSSKSIDEDDIKSPPPATRKPKIQLDWELHREFPNAEEAKSSIDPKMWGKYRKTMTEEGVKQYFRCNKVKLRGPQCAASIFHLFVSDKDVVLEYRTKSDHTHDDLTEDKNTKEAKMKLEAEVEKPVRLNVKRHRIMRELSQMEDVIIPTIQQLTTLIAKIRKKIFGPVTISMTELSNWLESHQAVPNEMHEPFVLSYQMDSECDEPFFRFIITTKYLLGLIKLRNFTHCDTTYKCIWQGFPVFMIGTTDYEKAYQPYGLCVCTFEHKDDFKFIFQSFKDRTKEILGFEMQQKSLVCDAAFAIINAFIEVFGDDVVVVMCWYHAKVAIEDKLCIVKEENRTEILSDIEFLHIASTPKIFDNAADLFLKKWSGMESAFSEYFEDQWLNKHRNWFVGAADFTPCQNNALESSNRYLKDSNTIRLRYPLPHFLQVSMQTVGGWSNDFTIGLRKFATQPKVGLELWTKGYNWAKANVETKIITQSDVSVTVEIKAQIGASKKSAASNAIVISDDILQSVTGIGGDSQSQAIRPKVTARKSTKKTAQQSSVHKSLSQPASNLSSQEMSSKVTTRKSRKAGAKVHESLSQPAIVKDLSSQATRPKVTNRRSKKVSPGQLSVSEATVHESLLQPATGSVSQEYHSKMFDEYKRSFLIWTATVAKNANALNESRCNCPSFAKNYICKHVVGLCIRLKLVSAPPEAKTVPIGQKRKRGRPSKTKPALMIQ